jgi:hypothetical protein
MTKYALLLGYGGETAEPILGLEAGLQATAITARLAVIDSQLIEALADSFVSKADSLVLDYPTHIAQLRQEGSRLLGALAQVTGMRLVYDSYSGTWIRGGSNVSILC